MGGTGEEATVKSEAAMVEVASAAAGGPQFAQEMMDMDEEKDAVRLCRLDSEGGRVGWRDGVTQDLYEPTRRLRE
jgi:hypothetical protein